MRSLHEILTTASLARTTCLQAARRARHVLTMTLLVMLFAVTAFTLSACVGLGGSLLLVPALSLVLGVKQGVVLAALLLAANNVAKVVAYRRTLPLRPIVGVILATAIGAYVGASLLVVAPAAWVGTAVISAIAFTFVSEHAGRTRLTRLSAPVLALGAGMTSGFAGTSGPLKGLALRGVTGDRQQLAGAAASVSLVADAIKASVYLNAALLDGQMLHLAAWTIPLVPFTAALGYRINRDMGERAFRALFWSVMLGYSVRVLVLLVA
jgi:uncharacterized protein